MLQQAEAPASTLGTSPSAESVAEAQFRVLNRLCMTAARSRTLMTTDASLSTQSKISSRRDAGRRDTRPFRTTSHANRSRSSR